MTKNTKNSNIMEKVWTEKEVKELMILSYYKRHSSYGAMTRKHLESWIDNTLNPPEVKGDFTAHGVITDSITKKFYCDGTPQVGDHIVRGEDDFKVSYSKHGAIFARESKPSPLNLGLNGIYPWEFLYERGWRIKGNYLKSL
jgi:hypothetical protein